MSTDNGAPQPTQNFPLPGAPAPRQGSSNRKSLFIVLGAAVAALAVGVVAVFVFIVPALTKGDANDQPATVAGQTASATPSAGTTEDALAQESATADATADNAGMPADAIGLPAGWDALAGPANVPADNDPLFSKFVTAESSFQYLKSWDYDGTFGITKDPETGKEMQQVAQGTKELDADGISTAFAFFAESEQGKFGSDPAKVKAAVQAIQAKLNKASTAELTQQLVGNKCATDFTSTTPETREFRRGLAVVVQFSCKTAAGDEVQAVNLFSVTPWGTPQMMGVSGHKSYWDAHPGTMEKLANSYRINKWMQQ
jgi:hypothetical protein